MHRQSSDKFSLNPCVVFGPHTHTVSSWCCTSSSSWSFFSHVQFVSVLFCYVFLCVLCFGCFVLFPLSLSPSSLIVSVSAQCNSQISGIPSGTPSNQALILWVSSTTHRGDLGGRSGANSLCTSMQPASLTDAGITSHALLSYSDQNAIDAIPQNVDIKNTKGECIAANRGDLFNGLLLDKLLYNEAGVSPGSDIVVFTATTEKGYKAGLGFGLPEADYQNLDNPDKYCNDFTSISASTVSSLGQIHSSTVDVDGPGKWVHFVKDPEAEEQCNVLNHIFCISSAPTPTQPTVAQDPQFVGLQGQRFQVHGIPEEYFNLVSHPFFQLNSHFTYLATGTCNYNDTLCWSHPGTYVDELGLMLPGYEIGIFAGEHQHGLTVTVNGQTMRQKTTSSELSSSSSSSIESFPFNVQFPLRIDNETINSPHTVWLEPQQQQGKRSGSGSGSGLTSSIGIDADGCTSCWLLSSSVSLSFLSRVHLVIDTPVATLDIYNADHFFNFGLELRAPRLLLAGAPLDRVPSTHGRTHTHTHTHAHAAGTGTGTGTGTRGVASAAISPATSPHPNFPMHGLVGQTWKNVKYPHGRLYAGEVDDYMLSDRRLFSTNFVYNEYQY